MEVGIACCAPPTACACDGSVRPAFIVWQLDVDPLSLFGSLKRKSCRPACLSGVHRRRTGR